MAEAETECAAPGLNTQEPECVTAHSRVSDVHHTDASLIKTDTDLGSTHNGHLKSESLDHAELGYVTRLHPEQIKTEPDEGGYLNAEQDIKCVSVQPEHIKSESSEGCVSISVKPEHIKSESSEGLLSDPINAVRNRADVDQKGQSEEWQCAAEPNPVCKNDELMNDLQTQCGDSDPCCETQTALLTNTIVYSQRTSYADNSFICTQCGQTFCMASKLNEDLIFNSNEKPHKCMRCETGCNQSVIIQNDTIYRNEKTHNSTVYTMYESANLQSALDDSESMQKSEKPYKCTHCERYFNHKSNFRKHMKIHTGDRPHKCPHCEKCFTQKCILDRHLSIHSGAKPHKCSECGKSFTDASTLRNHLKIHTGEKPHKCLHCGKCFYHKYLLDQHLIIHRGEKPHKCFQCGKCFYRKSHFRHHLRIHIGEKPYKCTECGKCFNQKSHLDQHLRIHTGEKPYTCTECGNSFTEASTLRTHLITHTGEKPHQCTECGKCFNKKSNLHQHMIIHTGEKPFVCSQCGNCFNHKSNLEQHMKIHKREKPYKGTLCGNV